MCDKQFLAVLDRAVADAQSALTSADLATDWKTRMLAKRAALRIQILPGFPKRVPFASADEAKAYLAPETIICLVCGKHYKLLGNHLRSTHKIDPDEYRAGYQIPWTLGLTPARLTALKSEGMKERLADPAFAQHWFEKSDQHRVLAHEQAKNQRTQAFRKELALKHLAKAGIQFDRWQEADYLALLEEMKKQDAILKEVAGVDGLPPLGAALKWVYESPEHHALLVAAVHKLSIRQQVRARAVSPETIAELKRLRADGMLQREIAAATGLSILTVARLLRR